MCEQCLAKTVNLNNDEPVVGCFYLVQATQDGNIMKNGDYGLVRCNDPSFIFLVTPEAEPILSDDEPTSEAWSEWYEKAEQFRGHIYESGESLKDSHRLVEGCYQAGYKDEDGCLEHWLFNYLAQFFKDSEE